MWLGCGTEFFTGSDVMKPDDLPPGQDKPADEYTGNYGRGGYYGYTYDQEAYNRQVKKASQAKKPGADSKSVPKEGTGEDGKDLVSDA
jgi:hypothetical protein